ncbi:DUF924 family protein [Roseisalinus antarcticus]|uniref:DUF924 domain-containing protein n=1 Tax=Roseisalinus antarcticus TaxID=254357 RepID=A0A1Y5RJ97_9RHOB|nr:DUF924 family protein [Roseisalinus antarcticus]SLN17514.1 hypothetical protein ROA7023_00313 [Roseisalinus antarcticus]
MDPTAYTPEMVLDFWFPDTGHETSVETHGAWIDERMRGGMDAAIIERFGDLTLAGARGLLDHWAETPRGRLALVIVLDQFPRSLWRDTPMAYGQDIKAARLSLEAIETGEADTLPPWESFFYSVSVYHCEGPQHLKRLEDLVAFNERLIALYPEALSDFTEGFRRQTAWGREIIRAYGRHPHRNAILGRTSTPEEEVYIAKGEFPHTSKPDAEDAED